MPSRGAAALLALAAVVLVVVLGATALTSFRSVAPSDVCAVQEGGPFDGRKVSEVRQPGEGVASIGLFNHQRCFPATQRNYIVSADANESDRGTVDTVEVPTLDAVNVRVEGAAYFNFSTDPAAVRDFYTRFGTRTFDGLHPYDGEDGWAAFLAQNFRPVLDNALRESIGRFNCVDLNNTCQYVTSANEAVKGNVQKVNNGQNLQEVQTQIERQLASDLNSSLRSPPGHPYFENVIFRLRLVRFDDGVQRQIDAAVAARTQVATARLKGEQRVAAAEADRQVATKEAQAIRAKRTAYADNPAQARIDAIRALPAGLRALGGNVSSILPDAAGR